MASNAKLFFEKLREEPNATAPFFEEEWLDFKGAPQNDADARKIWSKALSGYANVTDGLIVWGIDARKTTPRNIDATSGLRLIPDPAALESKLRDWIRDATNPPVMGVKYQSYSGSDGKGFVVCYVPQSRHKPRRAEWADRQYYYRASDDFLPAEPGLLRYLFYPQTNPSLLVQTRLIYKAQDENKYIPYIDPMRIDRCIQVIHFRFALT